MADISLDESLKICESAIAKAIEIGIKISVSVVDSGTNLVTTQRMAGSLILTVDSSRGKAVASVMFGESTGELEARADRPVFRALTVQYGGRFILGQGAVPMFRNGEIIGACGVGGGTAQEDEDCARAGISAV